MAFCCVYCLIKLYTTEMFYNTWNNFIVCCNTMKAVITYIQGTFKKMFYVLKVLYSKNGRNIYIYNNNKKRKNIYREVKSIWNLEHLKNETAKYR